MNEFTFTFKHSLFKRLKELQSYVEELYGEEFDLQETVIFSMITAENYTKDRLRKKEKEKQQLTQATAKHPNKNN